MKGRVNVLQGSISHALLLLMAPILISGLCQQAYNMTDAVVMGQYMGSYGIAIIGGSCNSLISTVTSIAGNLLLGCMTVIAFFYGAQDQRKNASVTTSLLLSFVVGLGFTVVYVCAARPILELLAVPKDLLDASTSYLQAYSFGFIPYFLFQDSITIYRAYGETKTPTLLLIGSFVVNIVLDFFFVGVCSMRQTGVALAFIITQLLAACVALYDIQKYCMISLKKLHWDHSILKRIMVIGIPACISSICYSGTNLLIQSSMNLLGSQTVAAYAIHSKIENIFWVVMTGFGVAITTMISQNYGAKQMERVKKCIFHGLLVCFALTAGICVIYYFFAPTLLSIFTKEPEALTLSTSILVFMSFRFLAYPIVELFSDALKCLNRAKESAFITLVGICGVRVAWIFFFAMKDLSYQSVLNCYPASWIITSVLFLVYWVRQRKNLLNLSI